MSEHSFLLLLSISDACRFLQQGQEHKRHVHQCLEACMSMGGAMRLVSIANMLVNIHHLQRPCNKKCRAISGATALQPARASLQSHNILLGGAISAAAALQQA